MLNLYYSVIKFFLSLRNSITPFKISHKFSHLHDLLIYYIFYAAKYIYRSIHSHFLSTLPMTTTVINAFLSNLILTDTPMRLGDNFCFTGEKVEANNQWSRTCLTPSQLLPALCSYVYPFIDGSQLH